MRLTHDVRLAARTTLKLGGTALAEVVVSSAEELPRLPEVLYGLGGRPLVMGYGSNVLARDGALPLVLVRLESAGEPVILGRENDAVRLAVPAGLRLPGLLAFCARHGLSGLESLAGIPGTVGGALAMNAGSYGVSFCERLLAAELWTPEKGVVRLEAGAWGCGYRFFRPAGVSGWYLALSVELGLGVAAPEAVRAQLRETYEKKKRSQPILEATAGCVFKNPPGESAGRLLEEAGFKGRRLGGMGFSERHANFLVNHGGGTAAEALTLLDEARLAVAERCGLNLALEVEVVG
jgi:UDP-N-acetylmuramate dehydrogenase